MRREPPGGFELDDDPGRIDVDAVHDFLANHAYWARGRPRETVERLIRTYDHGRSWGFFGEPGVNVLELDLALDRMSR